MTLKYKVTTASIEQVYSHLKACDGNFSPPLSSRINLLEYSRKMFEKSVSFEAWQGDVLVGMINAYLNDASNQTGFITNVSVLKEYMGKGIAASLLEMCLESARNLGFIRIRLEVTQENSAAIKLYSKAGFKVVDEFGENLLMERKFHRQSTQ